VKLEVEAGCVDLLKWRCDLEPGLDFEALTLDLRRHGLRARVFEPGLIVLDGEQGEQMVIVPRTGRVQIRVDLLTPKPERARVARRLLTVLEQACGERGGDAS